MINLLPPEYKQRRRIASLAYLIAVVYVIVGAAIFVGAAAFATYNFTTSVDIAIKEDKIAGLAKQKDKNNEITAKANFIIDRINSRDSYQESLAWEKVLETIAKATPNKVRLKNIKVTVNPQNKKTTIILQGVSSDRRSALLFRSKLAEDKTWNAPTIQQLNEVTSGKDKEFDFTIELELDTNAVKK